MSACDDTDTYLDGDHAIKAFCIELIVYNVASDDCKVREALFFSHSVDVFFLRFGVGKSRNLRLWELLSKE